MQSQPYYQPMPSHPQVKPRRRRRRMSLWNRFVLMVGYIALLYLLARGIIYILVLLGGNA